MLPAFECCVDFERWSHDGPFQRSARGVLGVLQAEVLLDDGLGDGVDDGTHPHGVGFLLRPAVVVEECFERAVIDIVQLGGAQGDPSTPVGGPVHGGGFGHAPPVDGVTAEDAGISHRSEVTGGGDAAVVPLSGVGDHVAQLGDERLEGQHPRQGAELFRWSGLFQIFLLDLFQGSQWHSRARRVGDLLEEAGGHAVFHAGVVDTAHQGVVRRPRDGDEEEPPFLVDSTRHARDPCAGLNSSVQQINEF